MNSSEKKALVAGIGTAFYQFLVGEDFKEKSLQQFKEFAMAMNSAIVDIQAYDDIHLMFFKFGNDGHLDIVAVGDFTADSYTLFNHFKEESIAEYVAIWELDSENTYNPLLQFHKRINDYPTVDINRLTNVIENGEFTVKLHSEDSQTVSHLIEGVKGTDSKGYSVMVDLDKNDSTYIGVSSVISHHTSDEFNVVAQGELLDQDIFHDATLDLVKRMLNPQK